MIRLRQADLREAMAKQAYADALKGYAPRVRSLQALAVLNEAAAALGRPFRWDGRLDESGDPRAYDWAPELERRPSFTEMGLYTLRRRGPATLAGQIWIIFRRWLAKYIPYRKERK